MNELDIIVARCIQAEQERDELAALLWEARQELEYQNHDDNITTSLIARIDAARGRMTGNK